MVHTYVHMHMRMYVHVFVYVSCVRIIHVYVCHIMCISYCNTYVRRYIFTSCMWLHSCVLGSQGSPSLVGLHEE